MSSFTISTTQLQAVLSKAIKGVGNNKLVPMTSLIAIEVKDGKATFTTTDKTNYLSLSVDTKNTEDFYVAVNADVLTKLVFKMTSENTTLDVKDNVLTVIGNGQYQITLEAPDGEPVVLPNPIKSFEKGEAVGNTDATLINNILASIKSALLTTADQPWYCCYHVDKSDIVATDTYTVGGYAKGFMNTPYLVDSKTMDLVGLLEGDINVYVVGDKMLFESDSGCVYTAIPEGIDKFSIDELREYITQDFDYSCKVSKTPILNLLDRISLFVGAYDNGEITLTFNSEGLKVTSRYAEETIKYAEDTGNVGDFTCKTDIDTLTAQIKSQLGGVVTIQYGNDVSIKLVDGDITSVVALLAE